MLADERVLGMMTGHAQAGTRRVRNWNRNVLWPVLPLLAAGMVMTGLKLESGSADTLELVVLLLVASGLAAIISFYLKELSSRIAATTLVSASAALAYLNVSTVNVVGAVGLFLATLMVLAISCATLQRASRRAAAAEELAALLVFEGEVASRGARDSRDNLCRTLLALSQRSDRAFTILRIEWQAPVTREDDELNLAATAGRRLGEHILRFQTITALEQIVRGSDVILPTRQRNCAYVACPETDAIGTRALSRRIVQTLPSTVSRSLKFSAASFPSDGYHLEQLIAIADQGTNTWTSADALRMPTGLHPGLRDNQPAQNGKVEALGPPIKRHSASHGEREGANRASN
jgi:hypothetical protein